MTTHTNGDREAALARVAQEERRLGRTLMNRIFTVIGPTRPFVAFYRVFGPVADRALQRLTGGSVFARLYGFPVLVLTTIGAKSGARRASPLMYVRDGDDFVVVGTNFGTERHPAWTGNLRKHPDAHVEVFGAAFEVVAERVSDADFERLWPAFTKVYAGYADYRERLTHREVRMFRLRVQSGRPL